MGFCCSRRKSGDGEEYDQDKLRKKIKDEIEYIHNCFKINIDDASNTEMFFIVGRIKLILSHFLDTVGFKSIEAQIRLEDNEYAEIDAFMNELIDIKEINDVSNRENGKI